MEKLPFEKRQITSPNNVLKSFWKNPDLNDLIENYVIKSIKHVDLQYQILEHSHLKSNGFFP